VDTESLKRDASSTRVPICVSACTKTFILSFTVNDFHYPFLSIFHSLPVKLVLIDNKIWSLRSESHGHWEIEEFNLGAFLLNVTYENTLAGLQW
jgi:hypothetical protein